jgi:UDP-N-acetylmuramate dehydrogenase
MNMTEPIPHQGSRGTLRHDEPMSRHVSWRAGGRAARCYVPADLDDLAGFLHALPAEEPVLFVGLGSNLLVRDGGFRGAAVLMHAPDKAPRLEGDLIFAEAGVAAPKVPRFAALKHLAGAEFMAGIPGTVGGALAMNAGCYGGETWDIVERVLTIDRHGKHHVRGKEEFEIGYRHCLLRSAGNECFAGAWFRLPQGNGEA